MAQKPIWNAQPLGYTSYVRFLSAVLIREGSQRDRARDLAKEAAENRLAIESRSTARAETTVTWEQLQQVFLADTAFIDFLQYRSHTAQPDRRGFLLREPIIVAFITTNSGPPIRVKLGPSRPIRAAVVTWKRAIDAYQRSGLDNIEKPMQRLAELVWNPLQEHLSGIKSLVIAPDGPLCFVSFAALPGRRPGSYALEDYAIQYTNSGRWIYQQLQRETFAARGEGLLVCGDIQYQTEHERKQAEKERGSRDSEDLLPDVAKIHNLYASAAEIEAVQDVFKNLDVKARA